MEQSRPVYTLSYRWKDTPRDQYIKSRLEPLFAHGRIMYFKLCPLCGQSKFVMSEMGETMIVLESWKQSQYGDGDNCDACYETHRRHPEVVEWVTRVLLHRDCMKENV